MPSIVNKRSLLCNESRALFLLEYKHELSLLKKLILITEKGIDGILPKDTWCYEGICHLFASSIVSHARMAYDNMLLGHFDAANMVLRALIENSACFEVIYLYEEDELWKYYLVQSYRDTIISPKHGTSEKDRRFLDDMYQRYDIGADFLEKGDKKKAYIDMPYGWTFKINKNFNAKGLCSLLEHGEGEYHGFQLMSPYSHGTSLRNMLSYSSSMDQIMSMLASIYISLFRLVYLYCMDKIDESFDPITEELENTFQNYFETSPWNESDESDE